MFVKNRVRFPGKLIQKQIIILHIVVFKGNSQEKPKKKKKQLTTRIFKNQILATSDYNYCLQNQLEFRNSTEL